MVDEYIHLKCYEFEACISYPLCKRELLKEQLSVQLFDRSNRRLKLTPAGERLLKAVSKGFNHICDTVSLLDSEIMSGPLVWATPPTATRALMSVAGGFQKEYPEVECA